MSKLVTFEQAKKLKELGYILPCIKYYALPTGKDKKPVLSSGRLYNWNATVLSEHIIYSSPTTTEALEWFREVIGIECEVCLRLCFMGDSGEAVFGGYEYIVFDHNTNKTISSTIYHNRNEAESALLDALIEYVSK